MFIFLFFKVFAEQLPIIEIQLGQQYEFEGKVKFQNRVHSPVNFFRFTIKQIEDKQDLIVVLKSITDKNSLPALYMSQTNQQYLCFFHKFFYFFQSPSNSDGTICGLEGLNVCTIDPSQLKFQDEYYLGIYCLADCKYYLRIHFEQEQILHLGESTIISGKGERLFKILYPENKDTFDRVIVRTHLVWDSKQQNNGTFYFYVNEGNSNPSPTKYDYKGEEIWTLGKGTVITNKIDNLTVLVISDQKLFFQTLSYPKIRNVSLYEQVDDLVSANSINYYNLVVQPENQPILNLNTLSIDLNPFDGNPDFYITTQIRPDEIKDYKWQTQLDKGFESIAISHRQRQNDSMFYIAIKGHEQVASYNFICYISNYQSRQLTTQSTESGYLEAGEMAQYVIMVSSQNQYTIEASFPEETAYIIQKKCNKNVTEIKNAKLPLVYIQEASPYNYYNCSVVDDDLNQAILGQTVEFQGTQIRKELYSLKFDYSVQECRQNVSFFDFEVQPSNCAYVMAIVNQQINGNLNYQLTLRDKQQLILIQEAQTRSLSLSQYDIAYLVFQNNDTSALEIKFQITVINGEIKIYASQETKFPDQTNYQIKANMDLDLISFKISEYNLTQPIYISISSVSVLRATITPVIVRNEKLVVKYIKLTDGQQQNIVQNSDEEIHYFSFDRNVDEPQPIFFHIRSSLGQFVMYILAVSTIDTEKPSSEHNHFVLQSSDHTLILQNGDKNYLLKGSYKLAVYQMTSGNSSYTIWVSSQNQINQLKYGHPQASTIDDQQSNFYYFLLNYNLTEVFIIRTLKIEESSNNSIQIYVSRTFKYPHRNQYDFRLDKSYISLKDIIVGDTIYIGVFSTGYNDYTLLIRGVQAITELLENQLQYIPMPSYSEYKQADIYFRLQNFDQSVQVQAATKFAEISLFTKVIDYQAAKSKIQNNDRSIFPNEGNFQVRNRETGTSSNKLLILTPQQMQQCQQFKTGCMMLLTVKLNAESLYSLLFGNHDDISNVSNSQGEDGYFTILISQSTLTLKNGDVSIGFSLAKMFSYYKFEVPYPIDIVELTVIPIGDGDPDIYVSKQNTSTDVYPNLEFFDFHSNQYKQDTLLLMQESFQNRDNSGVYIAGVTGFQEDVTFRISLDWADIQFNTLLAGQQFKKSIDKGVYFRYEHSKKKSFRIIVQGIQHVNLQISTLTGAYSLSSKTSFLKQLPFYSNTSEIKYQLDRNDELFGGVLQIDQNSSSFCYRCTYLIGIQCVSQGDLKLTVAINSKPLDLELGVQLLDHATEQGNIYFANASNTKSYIEILLHSGEYQLRTTTDILTKSSDEKVYNSTSKLVISFNDILYLLLKPTVEAKYQISFQRDSHVIQLIIGKPYKSDHIGEYEFTFDPIRHQEQYNLQLICTNCTQNLYSNNKKISKYLLVDPKESHLFEQQQDYRYQLSYNYSYKIVFASNTSFEIILSLDGVKYLSSDQKLQEIVELNKSIRYDVYGKTGQQIQISVINCIGKVHLNSNQLNSSHQYFYEYDEDLFFEVNSNETVLYTNQNQSSRLSVYNLMINEFPFIWQQQDIVQNVIETDKISFNISQVRLNTDINIDAMIYVLHVSNVKEAVVAFAGCNFDTQTLKYYDLGNETIVHIKKIILKPDVSQDYLIFEGICYEILKKVDDLPKLQILYFYVIQSVFLQERKAPLQYHYPIFEYTQIIEDPDEQEEEESIQKPVPEESKFDVFLRNYLLFILVGLGFTSILAIGFIIRFFLRRIKKVSNPGYNDEEQQDINNELPKTEPDQNDKKQEV